MASYVATNGRLYSPAGTIASLAWYPASGAYNTHSGALDGSGLRGSNWSSMGGGNTANQLSFDANSVDAAMGTSRGKGASVRCVQE